VLLITRETVMGDTPASFATSRIVGIARLCSPGDFSGGIWYRYHITLEYAFVKKQILLFRKVEDSFLGAGEELPGGYLAAGRKPLGTDAPH
jgi:hypothetical protein